MTDRMTPLTYTKAYFANQIEKAKIKTALTDAIPPNVTYYNLILALTEMTQDFARLYFEDEIKNNDPNK